MLQFNRGKPAEHDFFIGGSRRGGNPKKFAFRNNQIPPIFVAHRPLNLTTALPTAHV
jgi:hypothetical protein